MFAAPPMPDRRSLLVSRVLFLICGFYSHAVTSLTSVIISLPFLRSQYCNPPSPSTSSLRHLCSFSDHTLSLSLFHRVLYATLSRLLLLSSHLGTTLRSYRSFPPPSVFICIFSVMSSLISLALTHTATPCVVGPALSSRHTLQTQHSTPRSVLFRPALYTPRRSSHSTSTPHPPRLHTLLLHTGSSLGLNSRSSLLAEL